MLSAKQAAIGWLGFPARSSGAIVLRH